MKKQHELSFNNDKIIKSLKTISTLFIAALVVQLLLTCDKNENESNFESVTKQIDPLIGGVLSITNSNGVKVELILPEKSLYETTEITLRFTNKSADNPFYNAIIPGIEILPDNIELKNPATLQAIFANDIEDPTLTRLFYLDRSTIAYPLGNSDVSEKIIQGEIYHFCDFFSSQPTSVELKTICNKILQNIKYSGSEPSGFPEANTKIKGILQYEEMMQLLGEDELASAMHDAALTLLELKARDFLEQEIPSQPCKEYINSLLKFGEQLILMGCDNDLVENYQTQITNAVTMCSYISGTIEWSTRIECETEKINSVGNITGTISFTADPENYNIIGSGSFTENMHMVSSDGHIITDYSGSAALDLIGVLMVENSNELWADVTISQDDVFVEGTTSCETDDGTMIIAFSDTEGGEEYDYKLKLEDGYYTSNSLPEGFCNVSSECTVHITHMP